MSSLENANINNALQSLIQRAGPQISNAIYDASKKTGVNFAYMLEQAAAESNFKNDIKAKTSSAQGLYQFIEKTWLNLVKKHGHKYGLESFAENIDSKGHVKDHISKQQILKLRDDPKLSSYLAAEFAAENKAYLEKHTSAKIGSTELYLAHFLGAHGASVFLNSLDDNPVALAANLFPKAANANRNVFYNMNTGQPRTLSEIYDFFNNKFSNTETIDAAQNESDLISSRTQTYTHHPLFNNLQNNYMSLNVKSEHAESTEMSAIQNQIMRQNYNLPKAYNDILGNRMSFNLDLFIVLSSWDDMSSKASHLLSS